jgi:hypothetical protein
MDDVASRLKGRSFELKAAAVVGCGSKLHFRDVPQGTSEERAACAPDVHKFCEAALQDTMRVLACLQANRPKISAACNRVLVSHGQ